MTEHSQKQKHLRLYTEQPPKAARPPLEGIECLPELSEAFWAATGWALQYTQKSVRLVGGASKPSAEEPNAPTDAPSSTSSDRKPAASKSTAQKLAASIANVLSELTDARNALRQREAELAAGVPTVPHREEEKHLALRLEAVLRAGAEAVGCNAAALYLLDDATTQLKLRSAWGLPFDRLTAPARPLKGALADLEAMLGHAVVLDDDNVTQAWSMPEDFQTAVCVPVSTPTTLLGTLWIFSNERRDFSERQTNILEVVAGRLASDLEREMLLRTSIDGARLQQQVAAAERLQENSLPTIAPLLDCWDIAGQTTQAGSVGGAFHDWFTLPNGWLAVAVGQAAQQGIAGAIVSNNAKTALRSHGPYHRRAEDILRQTNLTLWTGSAGDQRASVILGMVETATGRICCASAGRPSVLRLNADGWQSLSRSFAALGEGPELSLEPFGCELRPGEALVICSEGFRDAADHGGRVLGEVGLAEALKGRLDLAAEELVAIAQAAFDAHAAADWDRSIVIVKRNV